MRCHPDPEISDDALNSLTYWSHALWWGAVLWPLTGLLWVVLAVLAAREGVLSSSAAVLVPICGTPATTLFCVAASALSDARLRGDRHGLRICVLRTFGVIGATAVLCAPVVLSAIFVLACAIGWL